MKLRLICTITILLSFFITGCTENGSSPTDDGLVIEGYIIEIEERRILVAEDVTPEEYIEFKNKTLQELQAENVELIYLSYENNKNLKAGNKVEIWINGGIDDSYPAQADVQKIEVQK